MAGPPSVSAPPSSSARGIRAHGEPIKAGFRPQRLVSASRDRVTAGHGSGIKVPLPLDTPSRVAQAPAIS